MSTRTHKVDLAPFKNLSLTHFSSLVGSRAKNLMEERMMMRTTKEDMVVSEDMGAMEVGSSLSPNPTIIVSCRWRSSGLWRPWRNGWCFWRTLR